ncbi:MAG: hypothetical protein H0V17_04915 [Deltaproteobacteria bacterium]|nr:hypothetical protein [Deltaproteobacteria bacterium]
MAPLVVLGNTHRFVCPITLVANGVRVIGVASAEMLRTLPDSGLAVATMLDGSATVNIVNWTVGRYSGVGLVELEAPFPTDHDVVPLSIESINASVDVHGAPAALVMLDQIDGRFERSLVPVYVDADDAGGMSDTIVYIVSPHHPAHVETPVEGATVFAWLPPEPALGRRFTEVVAFAMAYPYRAGIAKPRATPVIAELVGLEDLGRALLSAATSKPESELGAVAGEIVDPVDSADDPLAGFDD